MAELVVKRYGTALFETALEMRKVDEFYEEVQTLISILQSEQDFMHVLQHPQVVLEEKITLLETVFLSKASKEVVGLLVLIVKKNRQQYLIEILQMFSDMVKVHKGIDSGIVISSVALSDDQMQRIQHLVSRNLNKQVELRTEVDPSLIGGLRIQVGDHMIDGTIRGKMEELKHQLLDIQLA